MNGFQVYHVTPSTVRVLILLLLRNMRLLIPPNDATQQTMKNEVEECEGITCLQFVNILYFVKKEPVCEVTCTARWNDKSATSKNTVLTDYTPSQNIHNKQV